MVYKNTMIILLLTITLNTTNSFISGELFGIMTLLILILIAAYLVDMVINFNESVSHTSVINGIAGTIIISNLVLYLLVGLTASYLWIIYGIQVLIVVVLWSMFEFLKRDN